MSTEQNNTNTKPPPSTFQFNDPKELLQLFKTTIKDPDFSIDERLLLACENDDTRLIELLLTLGANINYKGNVSGSQPLHVACRIGHIEVVKFLIQNGSDINGEDDEKETPIFEAEDVDVIELLLENGALLNATNSTGRNLLHVNCECSNEDLVEFFIGKGCLIDHVDANGQTPLFEACRNGLMETVKLLIAKGCDINHADVNGFTPLTEACKKDNTDVVEILLENGANIEHPDYMGETPIFHALCGYDRDRTVNSLINKGCNINHINKNGETPIFQLCKFGIVNLMLILIDKGADLNHKTNSGKTVFDYVCMRTMSFYPRYYNVAAIECLMENYVEVPDEFKKDQQITEIMEGVNMRKERVRGLLLCIRKFCPKSFFSNEKLPLDLFKVILYKALVVKEPVLGPKIAVKRMKLEVEGEKSSLG